MTVNSINITSGPYTGANTTDQYSYTFHVNNKTQLSVYETTDLGVKTLLTVDVDYTVAGVGDDAGGVITRVAGNLPTNYIWYIRSNYIENQLTAFRSQGGFFPQVHEDQFDHVTFLIQQLLDYQTRSMRLADSVDIDGDFTIDDNAAARASNFLGFDTNGDLVLLAGTTGISVSAFMETVNLAANATDALALLGLVVSTFAKTLLDDTTAAEMRTTLDIHSDPRIYNYIALGSANAITVSTPDGKPTSLSEGHILFCRMLTINTSETVTLNLNSTGAEDVRLWDGALIPIGSIEGNDAVQIFRWDALGNYWVLVNPFAKTIEGIWTPKLHDIFNSDAKGQTYSAQWGTYTKIGNRVFLSGYMVLSSLGTLSGTSVRIAGLPFPAIVGGSIVQGMSLENVGGLIVAAGNSITGNIGSSQSYISVLINDSASGTTSLQVAELASNFRVSITGSYVIDPN